MKIPYVPCWFASRTLRRRTAVQLCSKHPQESSFLVGVVNPATGCKRSLTVTFYVHLKRFQLIYLNIPQLPQQKSQNDRLSLLGFLVSVISLRDKIIAVHRTADLSNANSSCYRPTSDLWVLVHSRVCKNIVKTLWVSKDVRQPRSPMARLLAADSLRGGTGMLGRR